MYDFYMKTDEILWQNVKALMIQKYGKENLNRTNIDSTAHNKDMAISLGSLQRIKAQNTATGLEVIDKLAYFFEVSSWQLLVPNMNPSNLPVLMTPSEIEQELYRRMKFSELIKQ